jgi:hypothetical protein
VNASDAVLTETELLNILHDSDDELTDFGSSDEDSNSSNEETGEEPQDEPSEWSYQRQQQTKVPIFSRPSGLLHERPNTPSQFFDLLFNAAFMTFLIDNINSCAIKLFEANNKIHARITKWKPLCVPEFRVFLGLLFHMGTIKLARVVDYWSTDEQFQIGYFSKNMSRNRFLLILRCLNFTIDNGDESRLNKISGLVKHFNDIMASIFYPDKVLCIDESLVLWRGRLWCRQYMKGKAQKYGVKLYLLTDQFGCVLKVIVYGGKADLVVGGKDHVNKVVKNLLEGKLGVGHSVYMDNFYNSISLTIFLIEHDTHVTGTLRPNRKGLPMKIKNKKLAQQEKISCYSKNGISVTKWNDRREVIMVSSEHDGEWQEYLTKQNAIKSKPNVILQYNKYMGGVDNYDQMMSYYNPEHKTIRWYKKLGIHIFSTMLCNAHNLYNRFGEKTMPLYDFRQTVIRVLVSSGLANRLPSRPVTSPSLRHASFKLPRDNKNRVKRKRCVMCYMSNKKRVNTTQYCPKCPTQPGLCPGKCFIDYHDKLDDKVV